MQLTKVLALAFGVVSIAPVGATEPDPVGIASPDGVGAMIIRDGKAETLRVATRIYVGDEIVTGVRGGVTLTMKDCAVVMPSLATYSVIKGCGTAVAMRAQPVGQREGALAAGAGGSSAALPVVGVLLGAWLVGAVSVATAENPPRTVPLSP